MKPVRRTPLALAATALALGSTAATALAAWPNDPGANFRYAPSAASQTNIVSCTDGAGGAFIGWQENGDVKAQHVTAAGRVAPGWPSGGITVCGLASTQISSSIAADGAGGFVIVWDDYRSGESDIYAQRVSAEGAAHWTSNGIAVCAATDYQFNAQVCTDRAGGAVFTWMDLRDNLPLGYDVYAQRLSAAGNAVWGPNGTAVAAVSGNQQFPRVVPDGTVGGAYFAWNDYRSGSQQVYASRFDGFGVLSPGWPASGTQVAPLAAESWDPAIVSDGNFGLLLAWSDLRGGNPEIYAQRLTSQGLPGAGWPASGLALTSDLVFQNAPTIVSDGAGGAVVAWEDTRFGTYDVFAQRVTGGGAVSWTVTGVPLTQADNSQFGQSMVADGAGGAVVAWRDYRAGGPPMLYAQRVTGSGTIADGFAADGNAVATAHWVQVPSVVPDGAGGAVCVWQHNSSPQQGFAQRIDRWGYLGVQPRIASVRDVPNDQGGKVKLSWDASPLDAWPTNAISNYTIYRSVPPQAALDALARDEAALSDDGVSAAGAGVAGRRAFVTTSLAGATIYWEQVGNVYATQLAGYSFLAPTAQDSVPGSFPRTLFMVRAEDWSYARRWDSDPDSAYSTDDLAPAAPAPFTGTYSGGATHLHWLPNAEADLAGYRLYRGTSAGFVPSPANLVASPPDTGHVDSGPAGYFYKLTAVDAHGNESAASLLTPSGTLAVEGGAPAALRLAPASPNPSRGATTCRFALPAAGAVRLAVYDAAGRLVRVLAEGAYPAGEHAVRWDGTGEGGARVPSGLYLTRLSFGGRTLTGKVARVE